MRTTLRHRPATSASRRLELIRRHELLKSQSSYRLHSR